MGVSGWPSALGSRQGGAESNKPQEKPSGRYPGVPRRARMETASIASATGVWALARAREESQAASRLFYKAPFKGTCGTRPPSSCETRSIACL